MRRARNSLIFCLSFSVAAAFALAHEGHEHTDGDKAKHDDQKKTGDEETDCETKHSEVSSLPKI